MMLLLLFSTTGATPGPEFEEVRRNITSADWTGIEARLAADPAALERIGALIAELDQAVDAAGLTNHEKAKARAITKALVALVESPEPEWKSVAELLLTFLDSRPVRVALNVSGLCSIVGAALKVVGVY